MVVRNEEKNKIHIKKEEKKNLCVKKVIIDKPRVKKERLKTG